MGGCSNYAVLAALALAPHVAAQVPTVDELAAAWMPAEPLRGIGPVQNFVGAVGIKGAPMDGTRPGDMASLDQMTFTPYHGNMVNSTVTVNGVALAMNETKWSACQVSRAALLGQARIENDVRLAFEQNVVMSRYAFGGSLPHQGLDVMFNLTGPIFNLCDPGGTGTQCGWSVELPTDLTQYDWSVSQQSGLQIGLVEHKSQNVRAVLTVISLKLATAPSTAQLRLLQPSKGFSARLHVDVAAGSAEENVLVAFTFGSEPAQELSARLLALAANTTQEWAMACSQWEERWQQGFQPGNTHFSGNLPALVTSDMPLRRMYYAGALALVSLERTNLPFAPRVFTISQGNPSQLNAASSMGGAGQFTWDLSFTANMLSLLDPDTTKTVLRFIVSQTDFSTSPFLVPQLWDDYSKTSFGQSTPYMFDYYAAFLFLSTYLRVTNDVDFLHERIKPIGTDMMSVQQYMLRLATAYRAFPAIPGSSGHISDFGGNLRCFLEVIPTYVHALPALTFGNALMLLSAAELLATPQWAAPQHSGSAVPVEERELSGDMRAEAHSIIDTASKLMYNGDGTFNCLYPNGSAVNVRTIADTVYIAQQMAVLTPEAAGRNSSSLLPVQTLKGMADFAMQELWVPEASWFRSLSMKDALYRPDDLLIWRADWGVGGSYPGLDGMLVEALVAGDGDFKRATEVFRACELVTHRGAMSQGIATSTPKAWLNGSTAAKAINYNNHLPAPEAPYQPAWPEYFQDGSFWPETLRDVANVAASFPEAMVRTLFGWNPSWAASSATQPVEAALQRSELPRPFNAELRDLRTPQGVVTLVAGASGVKLVKSTDESYVV